MRNYSDTTARAHHDEDEAQVMRAVFCPFMRHCCKAQLANNCRNESLWHRSGYFCIDIYPVRVCAAGLSVCPHTYIMYAGP